MTAQTQQIAIRLVIDVWADVLCPWCYVGDIRLARAVDQSGRGDQTDIRVRTFQFDPAAPATIQPTLGVLAAKYGLTDDKARSLEAGMARIAEAEGLAFTSDRPMRNTLDVLRLVHLAAEHGAASAFLHAVQVEAFSGNFDAFEPGPLTAIADGLTIPADEVRDVLATDRYADAVQRDHDEALRLGATGVPFVVIGGILAIPGAVETDQYADAIAQACAQPDER